MSNIRRSDLEKSEQLINVLSESLDGGFVPKEHLSVPQQDFCQGAKWVEPAIKFKCRCGEWHTDRERDGSYECPLLMCPVEPQEVREGYRRTTELSIDLGIETEYQFEVTENTSAISVSEFDKKTIVFTPNIDDMEFSDKVGEVVWLPIQDLPEMADETSRNEIISDIRRKRRELIDWERLDKGGNKFEEITYRLIARSDQFYDRSWGGRGPDQGKDAYCTVDMGGSGTRILVQAKGDPGSSLNKNDIRGMVQDAVSHDCEGLLLTTVNITGDAETKYESGGFKTAAVPYVKIWPGVEMKERISRHPDLIAEYFISQ